MKIPDISLLKTSQDIKMKFPFIDFHNFFIIHY